MNSKPRLIVSCAIILPELRVLRLCKRSKRMPATDSRLQLIVVATLVFLLFNSASGFALTIKGNFLGGQPSGPTFGGGNLVDIFEAAARVWEQAIRDEFTVTFDYGWGSTAPGGFWSSHQLLLQGGAPNPETHGLPL